MSWEDILKVGGEEYTRDDKGMITSTKRYMHRYSSDDAFVGGGYDGIIPFDPKERGNQGVYSTNSKEQAQEVADRWNKNNPTKEPYFVEETNERFYVVTNE
tara:strand:+ start:102 stop:404 length:303 start_codon:yes stop_codon:yes gene_type:complete